MSSLNLDLNYFDHQKAMRLESILGNGSDVLPIRLWAYTGRQSPEHGCLKMLETEIERVCRWWGKKGAMVSAMIETGFLERDGDFYQVHDWLDHSGHLATFKKRAIKAARKRWGIKRKSSNATSNASSSSKQCPSSTVHSSTQLTQLDKIKHLDFVWLTPLDYSKLTALLGREVGSYIERLNGYIGQIGEIKASKKYSSHYHTILNWHRKDKADALVEQAVSVKTPPLPAPPVYPKIPESERMTAEEMDRIKQTAMGGLNARAKAI
jgi:hypothetical protein